MIRTAIILGLLVGGPAMAKEHVITQKEQKFQIDGKQAKSLSLKKGDSVSILNEDNTAHHVFFKWDGKKVSEKQEPGGAAIKHTFDKEGKATLRCAIHPRMKIKVEVKP